MDWMGNEDKLVRAEISGEKSIGQCIADCAVNKTLLLFIAVLVLIFLNHYWG